MRDLKTIFSNAARDVALRVTSDWISDKESPHPNEEEVGPVPPWEKARRALKKTAAEGAKGTFYNTYLNTLNMLQKQKKTLPGKISIGMESPRVYGGQAPGRSKIATDTYREKLSEVQGRMRRFATEKYYASVGGYGK